MMAHRFWCASLLLIVWSLQGFGLKQELWLYMDQANGLYFNASVPDMANYTALLPMVNRYCSLGKWVAFKSGSYNSYFQILGSASTTAIVCGTTDGSYIKSLRHFADNDTSVDAISLYAGKDFDGAELLLHAKAFTGIPHTIGSLAITGKAEWMLFEGQVLDGNSRCYKIPSGYVLNYNTVSFLNLTTIGSVYKGCDALEIQTYRNAHMLA